MKALTTLFTFAVVLAIKAQACTVEIDGKTIEPKTLFLGSSTIANENNKSVLISCGKFEGSASGFDRMVELNQEQCIIISNNYQTKVFKCQ